MSNIPSDLKYTSDHEWIRLGEDGIATIGVTDYAQECLGDVTFVELPAMGTSYKKGDTFGVVESVKAASDLYMPAASEIIESNSALEESPELINQDPYGAGWIARVRITESSDLDQLMNPDQYSNLI